MNLALTVTFCAVLAALSVAAAKHGGPLIIGAAALVNVLPAVAVVNVGILFAGEWLRDPAGYRRLLEGAPALPMIAAVVAIAIWPLALGYAALRAAQRRAAPAPPQAPPSGPNWVPNSRTRTYPSAVGAPPRYTPHTAT